MPQDSLTPLDRCDAVVLPPPTEECRAKGVYTVTFTDKDGNLIWTETAPNLVTIEGRNLMLDTLFGGAGYTVTGPYMGLISSVGFSAIAVGDTAAQINGSNGWKEAGSGSNYPLLAGGRQTCVWNAASGASKSLSALLTFTIGATGGTVKGLFILLGAGASSTIGDTGGALYSAVFFSSGDQPVTAGGTISTTYSTSL